jgi:small subunit ribosomal protein S20
VTEVIFSSVAISLVSDRSFRLLPLQCSDAFLHLRIDIETAKYQTMANIKSQIKRNKQNETLRLRNKAVRSELKTREKAVTTAATAGEPTDELLRSVQKRLDMAAQKGVIHRNEAARRKSRLIARAAKLG